MAAEEKGSDLDVFEGLTKKKKQPSTPEPTSQPIPSGPPTMRGGLAMPPPSSKLPPPKSVGGALPKPKPPPKKSNSSPPPSMGAEPSPSSHAASAPPSSTSAPHSLPMPTPPPKKGARPSESDAPLLSVKPANTVAASIFEEPSGSILPGHAVAELDWDDEEESTSVFDRSASDLFGDLARNKQRHEDPDDTGRRDVGKAAALLASSGRQAKTIASVPPPSAAVSAVPSGVPSAAVPSAAPRSLAVPSVGVPAMPAPVAVPAQPAYEPMPRIPAPAPVPRDISAAASPSIPAEPRPQHPSWAPQAAPLAPPAATPSRVSGPTILLALFAVLAAVAGIFFYLRSSSAAQVEVTVTHNGAAVENATIFVGGQRLCEFSPCKVKLEPGKHDIRVTSGALTGRQSITIEGGKDVVITIPLATSTDQPAPVASSSAPPQPDAPAKVVLASGMPPEVKIKVFVDGQDKGTLPITLDGLKVGEVKLRFEGGDKYGKVEKTLVLKSGDNVELKDIKLPLLKVKVKFELKTRGAKVTLGAEGERESTLGFRGTSSMETLDTSKRWTVKATLKGYQDFEKTIDFDGAGEEITIDIELQKEEEKPAPTPDPVATNPVPTPGPGPGPDPKPVPTNDFGFINANSRPPSKVLIDGKPYGNTPVMGVKVKPGSHSVTFIHPELGTQGTSVTVAAGETKSASVVFKKKAD
jgi:serine/threonine-protein kinase